MNILPKKKWHVRTKDNIARVRRDEAAAREEDRKKREQFTTAENEALVNFLRQRKALLERDNEVIVVKQDEKQEHINLFADYKTHVKSTNKELEKEKKAEQEKYEKHVGYLTYVGQDTNEALRLKSWYEEKPVRLTVGEDREVVEKDIKIKQNHDPLTLIKSLLPSKLVTERRQRDAVAMPADSAGKHTVKKNKKGKRERHHKGRREHKNKFKYEDKDQDLSKKLQKLEDLRKERLRREAVEKTRQEALLAITEPKVQTSNLPPGPRVVQKYNSQFNPEIAKQNIN